MMAGGTRLIYSCRGWCLSLHSHVVTEGLGYTKHNYIHSGNRTLHFIVFFLYKIYFYIQYQPL